MRKPIFKNTETQKIFDKQGYVVVKLIDEVQLEALNSLFEEKHKDLPPSGFFASSYSPDKAYKDDVSNKIVEILKTSYEEVFENYQPFGASFLVKMPSEDSALAVHQDWTIVDEEENYALNCWIPLTKITKNNGPLMVLPGSHFDNFKTLRAPTLNFFFSHEEEKVMDKLVPVIPNLGEAIVLNQSLIHYSPPNHSKEVRRAITAGIKTKGTPMWFHYKNKETKAIERFLMPEDFLISFENFGVDIFEKPKGELLKQVEYDDRILSSSEVESILVKFSEKSGSLIKTKGFINNLKSIFRFAN